MENSTAEGQEIKKPRRSQRISSQSTPLKDKNKSYLPSPLTHEESTASELHKEPTASPPEGRPSQIRHRTPPNSTPPHLTQFSSPPADTQAFSQLNPSTSLSHEVEDEDAEGVWGYLVPIDNGFGDTLVLKMRSACPAPFPNTDFGKGTEKRAKAQTGVLHYGHEEQKYEIEKTKSGFPSGGYLIGRHPECGMQDRRAIVFQLYANRKQIASLTYPRYRTGIASSLARTRMERPSQLWKIFRAMALSSMRLS